MEYGKKQYDGEERAFLDLSDEEEAAFLNFTAQEFVGDESLPFDKVAAGFEALAQTLQEQREYVDYQELFVSELPTLFLIAGGTLRFAINCSDRQGHIPEVVQQGALKFIRAARVRDARGEKYDTPEKVLRKAVWQEGVWHSKNCRKQMAVDFNDLSQPQADADAVSRTGYNALEMQEANSYDPSEMLNKMMDLKELLSKVTDQKLFEQYYERGETLEEIAKNRSWSTSKAQRMVNQLKKDLGLREEKGPPSPAPDG